MRRLKYIISRWWWSRFDPFVRMGWMTTDSALKKRDYRRAWLGVALVVLGLVRRRSRRKLIYKTSIDVDEGTTIRVFQGRRPIAETAPTR